LVDTNPPALSVNIPLTVEDVPKLTPVVVLTLLKVAVPDTVCVAVPPNVTACVPESAIAPEFVKVVPVVLLLMVNVFAVAVRVPAALIITLEAMAAVFCVTL
jgi:hypothetical protein